MRGTEIRSDRHRGGERRSLHTAGMEVSNLRVQSSMSRRVKVNRVNSVCKCLGGKSLQMKVHGNHIIIRHNNPNIMNIPVFPSQHELFNVLD